MKLSFNNMLYSLSYALDCVENELLGVATNHGKRVAYLCICMGKYLKLTEPQMMDLAACAVLHDNALTQYIDGEYKKGVDVLNQIEPINLSNHCVFGEKNMEKLPLCKEAYNAILYHHENADGSGFFGKQTEDTPLFAQLIHIADQVDAGWNLGMIDENKYNKIITYLKKNEDILFSSQCIVAFCNAIEFEQLRCLKDENIDICLEESIKHTEREYSEKELVDFAVLFANIIDYKSKFTNHHSLGLAEKAAQMGKHYGFEPIMVTKLFVAGALHDVGKLAIPSVILEKPGQLNSDEFEIVKNHVYQTYLMLKDIKGLEDITRWASLHHEKLNGKGYPFKKTAEELGFNERLMACLDVYQALTEERPYKSVMTHEKSMGILEELVEDGSLDGSIVEEIGKVYCNIQ